MIEASRCFSQYFVPTIISEWHSWDKYFLSIWSSGTPTFFHNPEIHILQRIVIQSYRIGFTIENEKLSTPGARKDTIVYNLLKLQDVSMFYFHFNFHQRSKIICTADTLYLLTMQDQTRRIYIGAVNLFLTADEPF